MIAGNSATRGGGLCNENMNGFAVAHVRNTTFAGNTAPNGFGGAVFNSAFNGGNATTLLTNSTLSGNQAAAGSGGAISNDGSSGGTGTVILTNCTFNNNSAAVGGGIYNSNFREPPARSCGTAFSNEARVAQIL